MSKCIHISVAVFCTTGTIDCPQVSNITRFNCSGTGWTDLEKP